MVTIWLFTCKQYHGSHGPNGCGEGLLGHGEEGAADHDLDLLLSVTGHPQELFLEFWEQPEVTGIQLRQVGGCGTTSMPLGSRKALVNIVVCTVAFFGTHTLY